MAAPWLKQLVTGLSPLRTGFAAGAVYVGFMVDRVALEQIFLRFIRFSPVNIFPPWFSIEVQVEGDY
jgi:hypothetical protein